jgi:hypothetical protein
MRDPSDPDSTDLRGATAPNEALDDATSSVHGEGTERLSGNSGSNNETEPRIDALTLGSETPDARSSAAGETTAPGESMARLDFLTPSEQPRRLGRLGPYEVLERIGQVGMGIVLKALDPRLARIVAIKILAPSLASSTPTSPGGQTYPGGQT